jgi:putative ABC transport system permease protein
MTGTIMEVVRGGKRLRNAPSFTITVIGTLASGFAAVAAGYLLVDAVVLRPLPFAEPDRLVTIHHSGRGIDISKGTSSEAILALYQDNPTLFSSLSAYAENVVSLTEMNPEQLDVCLVTTNLFGTLAVRPSNGRLFTSADDLPGAPAVVVISHSLWMRRYGGDPAIVGRTIELNRKPKLVVGVMPSTFSFPRPSTAVWYPLGLTPAAPDADTWYLKVIGRLKPDTTTEAASASLQALLRSADASYYGSAWREGDAPVRVRVHTLRESIIHEVETPLEILLCVGIFVLGLTYANVVNLVILRAERRRRDLAVRSALGAPVGQLLLELFSESFWVSLVASILAVSLLGIGVHWRFGLSDASIPRLEGLAVDRNIVALIVLLLIATAIGLALISYIRTSSIDVASTLRGGRERTAGGRSRLQTLLVGFQLALAFCLLIGCITMVKSFVRLTRVPLGFEKDAVWTGFVSLPYQAYKTYQDRVHFFSELERLVMDIPGVQACGAISTLPLKVVPHEMVLRMRVEDDGRGGARDNVFGMVALGTAQYCHAMQIPILMGRTFQPGDGADDRHPIVVNRSLAAALFGPSEGIGRRISIMTGERWQWCTVVGIAGDVPGEELERIAANIVYLPVGDITGTPWPTFAPSAMTLVVRSRLPVGVLTSAIRTAVAQIDDRLPVSRVETMSLVVRRSTSSSRLVMFVLASATGVSLLLAVVGIYSVASYVVATRRRELGIRLALGARGQDLVLMVLRENSRTVLGGLTGGFLVALALKRYLDSVTFESRAGDPITILAAASTLAAVALLAGCIPARSAGRADPVAILRSE